MIVLDEHLQGLGIEDSLGRWYRGQICIVTDLRPGTTIKDDAIPTLLRASREPTFVTLNTAAVVAFANFVTGRKAVWIR